MFTSLRVSLLTALMFSCSLFFSQSSFASTSLLEQFSQSEQWQEKQQLAKKLLNQNTTNQEQSLDIYMQLGDFALAKGNFSAAVKNYQLAEQATSFAATPKRYFLALKMQGVTYYYQGLMQQAVIAYSRALSIAKKLPEPIAEANLLSNIGLAYFDMFNMEQALKYYKEAKDIYEEHGNAQDKADILHNIAGIYIRLSSYDTALEMYRETLEIFQKLGDEDGIAQSYGNMGVAYSELGQYQLSLHYYQRALRYYQETNNAYFLSSRHANIANVYLRTGDLELALSHAEKAVEFAKSIDNKTLELAGLLSQAKIELLQGKLNKAEATLTTSVSMAKQYKDDLRVQDGAGMMALIKSGKGDYAGAVASFDEFVRSFKSEQSIRLLKSMSELQSQIQASQLSQEIVELKQLQHVQELEMSKQRQLGIMLFILFVMIVVTGITIYRRSIEKGAKEQLSLMVAKRTKELEETAEQLRSANEIKSQFLANISHEIRTPLTAILGQTDNLMNGYYKPEQLNDELAVIQKQSDHLKELINDVLDISKIEANKLELSLKEGDLVRLLTDVHSMLSGQAKDKGLNFTFHNVLGEQFYCQLDFTRIKQILINLCANAIKFTNQGEVELKVSKVEQGVWFRVTDTGIGMNTEQLKQIFECFRQGDNSISRRFGGTGLGLSLSQQLAMMMGGYISVESELNKGSIFSFYLPCKERTPSSDVIESEKFVQPVVKGLSGKVLLAEDHPDNRRLIARYLESMGLEVIAVENGEQAVEQCLKEFPDVVLLDIQMPVLDGLKALKLLQECGFTQPVYALTANAISHEIDSYLQAGFTGYLAKPIDKKVFYTQLAKHCKKDSAVAKSQQDMSDLVASFINSFEHESALIQQHFAAHELFNLQQDAHRIGGAAKMFALDDIADSAMALESALKQDKTADLTSLVAQLLEHLHNASVDQNSSISPS